MDPITLLLSALSLGNTGGKRVSDPAIKDAYVALKALIVSKFGATRPNLESILTDYAEDPETYQAPAARVLSEAGIDRDQEVLDRAADLLRQVESALPGISGGLVGQINAQGGRVLVL